MTKIQRKVAATIATGAMLLSTVTPVFAGTSIEISGNGAESDNDANVAVTQVTTVNQVNDAKISNYVDANADTGNNDANQNTGGDVNVQTGDAAVGVSVENDVNSNSAEVDCCPDGDTEVLISGNGFDSDNTVNLAQTSQTAVTQLNEAKIYNKVDADAKTGKNDANQNTGGDVLVDTGSATTIVSVSNSGNANSARVGGNGSGGGTLSARILGNGAQSDNDINLAYVKGVILNQWNESKISNYVDADAKTGKNDANQNTGGAVGISTGDAVVAVGIDNMTNFNVADVDCGCLLDVVAKIAGNGFKSDNDINAALVDQLAVLQGNTCGGMQTGISHMRRMRGCLKNAVMADAKTGKNDANQNSGDPDSDPSVSTGDADSVVEISNSGNVNAFGEGAGFELPGGPGFNFNFSLDLSILLGLLGL